MQLFIIGYTKTGKSTLARMCAKAGYSVYEAGAWARREYASLHPGDHDDMCPAYKNALAAHAMKVLSRDPMHSMVEYGKFMMEGHDKRLIVGVRNPGDFIHMLSRDAVNRVIFITRDGPHGGNLGLMEQGVDIIHSIVMWMQKIGQPLPSMTLADADVLSGNIPHKLLRDFI